MFHRHMGFNILESRSLERLTNYVPTDMPPHNVSRIAEDRANALTQIKETKKSADLRPQRTLSRKCSLAQFTATLRGLMSIKDCQDTICLIGPN